MNLPELPSKSHQRDGKGIEDSTHLGPKRIPLEGFLGAGIPESCGFLRCHNLTLQMDLFHKHEKLTSYSCGGGKSKGQGPDRSSVP